MKPIFFIAILAALVPAAVFAESEQVPDGTMQEKPVVVRQSEEIVVPDDEVEKSLPKYSMNLKQLLDEARRNIMKVDAEILRNKLLDRNRGREAEINEHFEAGNRLYEEGRLEEAKAEWQKTLEISKHPEMKEYIRKAEWHARENERKLESARQQEDAERKNAERERLERLHKAEKFLKILESKEGLFDDSAVLSGVSGK